MPDADWFEFQYNPRKSVLNASAILDDWRKRSALLRSRLSPMCDLKYGSHPRETLDLFRVPGVRRTLVYIHGGYWRSLSKLETSFIAEHFVAQGISVLLVNYPLCPDVTVADIRASVLKAFAYTWHHVLTPEEKTTVVVSGHSAGGHLAALHTTEDWQARGLPSDAIKAIVSLSGVFDPAPLIHTSINADIRLIPATASPLNLLAAIPRSVPPLLAAVGGEEPEEFHRQSRDLCAAWNVPGPGYSTVPGVNHFTIVEAFADPAHTLHRETLAFLTA